MTPLAAALRAAAAGPRPDTLRHAAGILLSTAVPGQVLVLASETCWCVEEVVADHGGRPWGAVRTAFVRCEPDRPGSVVVVHMGEGAMAEPPPRSWRADALGAHLGEAVRLIRPALAAEDVPTAVGELTEVALHLAAADLPRRGPERIRRERRHRVRA